MAAIFQTTFWNGFSWMKLYEYQLKVHWNLFPRVKLTIFRHWFREWLGAVQATSHYLNKWWLVCTRPQWVNACMMASWHRNAFCVTDTLWEKPVTGGFPSQRYSNMELWYYLLSVWTSCWKPSGCRWFQAPGRSCDVIVMVAVFSGRREAARRALVDSWSIRICASSGSWGCAETRSSTYGRKRRNLCQKHEDRPGKNIIYCIFRHRKVVITHTQGTHGAIKSLLLRQTSRRRFDIRVTLLLRRVPIGKKSLWCNNPRRRSDRQSLADNSVSSFSVVLR